MSRYLESIWYCEKSNDIQALHYALNHVTIYNRGGHLSYFALMYTIYTRHYLLNDSTANTSMIAHDTYGHCKHSTIKIIPSSLLSSTFDEGIFTNMSRLEI